MNTIFMNLIAGGKVAIYIDNILIYSINEEIQYETTYKVLHYFKQYNLSLKPKKCKFDCNHIKYLGMIIELSRVSMYQGKVTTITNWPISYNLRDIQGFFSFAHFYH